MKPDRRQVIRLGAAVPLAFALAGPGRAQDLSDLAAPPEIGEMAIGSTDAPVTVIEYASATCPHCARFHIDVFKTIKEEYVDTGKVRFVFREFPFDDLALAAFMLARCAPGDKYFPMIDILFEQQQIWTKDPRTELLKIAKLAGFTEAEFDACLKNEQVAKGIIAVREKGESSYGVESTPTFFINGEMVRGNQSVEEFRKLIDAKLG